MRRKTSHTLTPFAPVRRNLFDRLRQKIRPGLVIRGTGSYHILRLIGEGGMGRVFLAEKLGAHSFSKLMAIKVMPKSGISRRDARRFLDEARLTAGLNHPNIVQVYQLGESRHDYFIVMELVFGVTLLQFIERHSELKRGVPLAHALFIMSRILSGLDYAHHKQDRDGAPLSIVHRDICPSNILVSFRGIPKLSDFGVAKAKTSYVEDEHRVVFGKYPYMAPEQVRREGTDPRSDLYSLGLVMYELFTGALAHEVGDTKMLLDDLDKAVPPPEELNPDIPPEISTIITRATALEASDRYETARAMRLDIEAVLRSRALLPEGDDLADYLCELFPQARRHRWW